MTDQRRFADQPRPDAAQLAYARDQWGSRHQPSSLIHPDIRDGMHSMARFGNAARGVPVVIVRYIAAICRCYDPLNGRAGSAADPAACPAYPGASSQAGDLLLERLDWVAYFLDAGTPVERDAPVQDLASLRAVRPGGPVGILRGAAHHRRGHGQHDREGSFPACWAGLACIWPLPACA